MRHAATLVAVVALAASGAHSAIITVARTADGGVGSLRWAINRANNTVGPDTIRFDAGLDDQAILPTSELPYIMDDETKVIGDIDGDDAPDIVLNGRLLSAGSGLIVTGNGCVVAGLTVIRFPACGIILASASQSIVRSCHVGVNHAGTKPAPNLAEAQVRVIGGGYNRIGGLTTQSRNLIEVREPVDGYKAGGFPEERTVGVEVINSEHNVIAGNYINLSRDGLTVLGGGRIGIDVDYQSVLAGPIERVLQLRPMGGPPNVPCDGNVVGGESEGDRNVIAGVDTAVKLGDANECSVLGNYLGFLSDGRGVSQCRKEGVLVWKGSQNNVVGGTAAETRNIFCARRGVVFDGLETAGNAVRGNYFGLDKTGTRQRPITVGVSVQSSAGPQTIGGGTAKAGNWFATAGPAASVEATGVLGGQIVRNNHFGMFVDGRYATGAGGFVTIQGVPAEVSDNVFGSTQGHGIYLIGTPAGTKAFRNVFRACGKAVWLRTGAYCLLGNLGNSSTTDDGGNVFREPNTWTIYNETPNRVRAEGNDFRTTSAAQINAEIYDRRDDGTLGRVDYNPLIGGVVPTEAGGMLAVTGLAATPSGVGAEIAFSLSAAARVTVEVLSIAGRPVATVRRDMETQAGTQRLVWTGRDDRGLAAPAGMYLARITGRTANGQQASAVCSLAYRR